MALTANVDLKSTKFYKVDSQTIASGATVFEGALLNVNASGNLAPATDSATDLKFAGVSRKAMDNSANASTAGPLLEYGWDVECDLKLTWTGANMTKLYIVDDESVALAAVVANNIFCAVGIRQGNKGSTHTRVSLTGGSITG